MNLDTASFSYKGKKVLKESFDKRERLVEDCWYVYVPCREDLRESETGNFEKRVRRWQKKMVFLGLAFWVTTQKVTVWINADYWAYILGCCLGGFFDRPPGEKTIDEIFIEKGLKP